MSPFFPLLCFCLIRKLSDRIEQFHLLSPELLIHSRIVHNPADARFSNPEILARRLNAFVTRDQDPVQAREGTDTRVVAQNALANYRPGSITQPAGITEGPSISAPSPTDELPPMSTSPRTVARA
jgi:hypothetical protein